MALKKSTVCVHSCDEKKQFHNVSEEIVRSDTFYVEKYPISIKDADKMYLYTRLSNPTLTVLEKKMASLDSAESAVVFASGMGAISGTLLTLLKKGDHVVCDKTMYNGTINLLHDMLTKFGVQVTSIEVSDVKQLSKAIKSNTKVVYFETPCNPTLRIIDIKTTSEIIHKKNKNIKVIVDNTFATPISQTPLTLGADITVYSLTKYINGHSDVLGGCVCGKNTDMIKIRSEGLL